ncbi:MAG: nuclear transport factor 2 family protein [Allomuricauda sp.]
MKELKHILVLMLVGVSAIGIAQADSDSALFKTLKEKDSLLFDAAFNQCDIATLNNMFTEDFEFYHDKGGFTESKETFINQIKEGCSNRKQGEPQPAKRFLVTGSLEVFPLYKNGELYGAIQHGVHTFEFLDEKKEYQKGDIAKYTHLWILEEGNWKIKRELSYDHQIQHN